MSTLRFAEFELDRERLELRRGGEPVSIRHQTMQLLCLLAERPGQTISREALAQALWDSTQIDFDQRLNAAVRDLRRVLGDDDRSVPLIQTAPRRGYRLAPPARRWRPRLPLVGVAAALLMVAVGFWLADLLTPAAPIPADAQQRYVEARALLDGGDPSHSAHAIELLQAVIEQAPQHADAWAALAKAHVYSPQAPASAFPLAKHAAQQALVIDADHVSALRQAATVAITWDRDWSQADSYLKRALALAPGDAKVYHAYASLNYLRGELAAGEEMMQKALTIDPLSVVLNTDLVWFRTVSGDYQQAIETCRLIEQVSPDATASLGCALHPTLLLGQIGRAATIASAQITAQNPEVDLSGLSDDQVLRGYWLAVQQSLQQLRQVRYVDPVSVARIHANLGDPAQALDALQQAVEDRSLFAPYIHLFPEFRALHTQPRFVALIDQIGLPGDSATMLASLRASHRG